LPNGEPPVPGTQPNGEPPVLPKPPPANGEALPNGEGLPKAGWTEPMSPEVAPNVGCAAAPKGVGEVPPKGGPGTAPKGLADEDVAAPKGLPALNDCKPLPNGLPPWLWGAPNGGVLGACIPPNTPLPAKAMLPDGAACCGEGLTLYFLQIFKYSSCSLSLYLLSKFSTSPSLFGLCCRYMPVMRSLYSSTALRTGLPCG